jgi:hypothetical protein
MANISDTNGTVTLTGKWTSDMCRNLNLLREAWAAWCYNIDIYENFAPDALAQSFCGNGRWAFHANLESLDGWTQSECETKPDLAVAYAALTTEMELRGSQITFVYADEEPGCLFICTGTCNFAAKDGHFIITSSSEDSHDYGWEAYLSLDFGGEDLFDELVEGLLKLLLPDKSGRGETRERVAAWAMANTLPHQDADCLDDEKIAAFKSAFTGAQNSAKRSSTHG